MQFNNQKSRFEFTPFKNQKVFALNRQKKPWPARIVNILNSSKSQVCFYLTKQSQQVSNRNLWQFNPATIDRFADECDTKLKSAFKTVRSVLKKKYNQTGEGAELIDKLNEVIDKQTPDSSEGHSTNKQEEDVEMLNKSLDNIFIQPSPQNQMVPERVPAKSSFSRLFVIPEVSSRLEQSIQNCKQAMKSELSKSVFYRQEERYEFQENGIDYRLKRSRDVQYETDAHIVRKRFRKSSQKPNCKIEFRLPPRGWQEEEQINIKYQVEPVSMVAQRNNNYLDQNQEQKKKQELSDDSTATLESNRPRSAESSYSVIVEPPVQQQHEDHNENDAQQEQNQQPFGPLNLSEVSTADSFTSHPEYNEELPEIAINHRPPNVSQLSTAASLNTYSSEPVNNDLQTEVASNSTQDSSNSKSANLSSNRNKVEANHNNTSLTRQSQFMQESHGSLENPHSMPIPFIHQKHLSMKESRRAKYSYRLHQTLQKLTSIIRKQRQSLTMPESNQIFRFIQKFKVQYLTAVVSKEMVNFFDQTSRKYHSITERCGLCYMVYLYLKERWERCCQQCKYHEVQCKDLEDVINKYKEEHKHLNR